jgi:hypothetical protein
MAGQGAIGSRPDALVTITTGTTRSRTRRTRSRSGHERAALLHDRAAEQAALCGEPVRPARERGLADDQRAAAEIEDERQARAAEALASFTARELAFTPDSDA